MTVNNGITQKIAETVTLTVSFEYKLPVFVSVSYTLKSATCCYESLEKVIYHSSVNKLFVLVAKCFLIQTTLSIFIFVFGNSDASWKIIPLLGLGLLYVARTQQLFIRYPNKR